MSKCVITKADVGLVGFQFLHLVMNWFNLTCLLGLIQRGIDTEVTSRRGIPFELFFFPIIFFCKRSDTLY